jgi:DNA polymerase
MINENIEYKIFIRLIYDIVMHIHDELVIEADPEVSLDVLCEQMGRVPDWTPGLKLRADGYICDFYMKD